jgi:hypothetical protein
MNSIDPTIRPPVDEARSGKFTRTTIILIMLVIMIIIDKFLSGRRAAAHASSS